MLPFTKHPSSYRDPSGFLFYYDEVLYRQVNQFFKEDFDQFISGGLFQYLVDKGMLIEHCTVNQNLTGSDNWHQTLKPERIPFISYPYEWCFDMLKDGALITLEAALEAMNYGMMLKDASAYNVQWHKGRMTFIDTLSFEKYDTSRPWIAYRQFCEHFLAPLALMHYKKLPLQNLILAYPDGIPLGVAQKFLPGRSKFNLNTYLHLHLHASVSGRPQKTASPAKTFSSTKLKNLLQSLKDTISSFSLDTSSGVWSDYYTEAYQREDYVELKKQIITDWINQLNTQSAIDIGANEGEFSELLANKNIYTISADFDHYSINRLYRRIKQKRISSIHPLIIDFANPSPAVGVNNAERSSFIERTKTDLVLALAVVHHLVIGKNIPFESIAELFSHLGKNLIVEFIPKDDNKIQFMLQQKKDVYYDYNENHFLNGFKKWFSVIKKQQIANSNRIVYLMQAHEN
jgi:2-polyprenyl-3-methyl-5-hydroxy-6-metoxy-1,4-benzoquinol methylase